jgi:hypothetical protein
MTSGSIDKAIAKLDKKSNDYYVKMQKIIEDHAIEASICKIVGSETLAFVADESIQILGGAGFIEDYGMATIYRDERINRIFEGTNEINRLLICGITLKKSILEELPIRDAITLREKDWFAFSLDSDNLNERIVEFCRSACLATLNMIILKYGQDFKNNQWIQEPFANMLCSLLIIDTILKRTKNIKDPDKLREHLELLELSLCEHYKSINKEMDIIVSEIYKDTDRTQIDKQVDGYKKQLHYTPNEIELMKKVVTTFYKHEKYYLD